MGSSKKGQRPDHDGWLEIVSEQFPEVALSGYWENLEQNCERWAREVTVSDFWLAVSAQLPGWRTGFRAKYQGDLLSGVKLPDFVGKGAARMSEKVSMSCAKDAAKATKLFPEDCGAVPRLKDLVRTRVSCRFIEGVQYMAEKLVELAESEGLAAVRSPQGKLRGYFAQHVTFPYAVTYRAGGVNRTVEATVEIQVATELSTTVWDATHTIYEDARSGKDDPAEWQWSPRDPRFVSRQLGHMIHLADGLLSQLRDHARAVPKSEGKAIQDD